MTRSPATVPVQDETRPAVGSGESRWYLWGGLKRMWHNARAGWRELPEGALKRWLIVLVIGYAVALGVTWLVTVLGRRWSQPWMNAWDERWLRWMAENNFPTSYSDAIIFESPGNLAYMIPLVVVSAWLACLWRRPLIALTIVVSYVLARPLTWFGWWIWDRPRPSFIAEGLASPPLHSYPSGHVVLSASVYGVLAYLWVSASRSIMERVLVIGATIVWLCLVVLARTRLGAHWPSDIIAGGVIAATWFTVLIIALRVSGATPLQAGKRSEKVTHIDSADSVG